MSKMLLCICNSSSFFELFFEILVLLINVFGFYLIMLTRLQVPTNFKLKYFFNAQVLGEISIVHEPHYYDALHSSSLGVKRSCTIAFKLQILNPPLILDVDFEGLEPLNFCYCKGWACT